MNFERIYLKKDGVSVSWEYEGDYIVKSDKKLGQLKNKPCMRLYLNYKGERENVLTSFSAKQSFNERYVALMYVLLYVIEAIDDGVELSSIANQLHYIDESNYAMYKPTVLAV